MRIPGNRFKGIKQQAPRNYKASENSGAHAQDTIDHIVSRANTQYLEAINTDGVSFMHWVRGMDGHFCTCYHPVEPKAKTHDKSTPVDTDDSLINAAQDGDDGTVFKVRGFKERRFKSSMPRESESGIQLPEPSDAGELNASDVDFDDADFNEVVDESGLLKLGPDSGILFGGESKQCGICFTTKYVEGYKLSNGKRIVLDASGTYPFALKGMTLETQKAPHAFSSGQNTQVGVEWTLELPAYFTECLIVRVRNNVAPADGVVIEYKFTDDLDTVPFSPLTVEFLRTRRGLRTNLIVRVRPKIDSLENFVEFTHVEIVYIMTPFPRLQMDALNESTNFNVFDYRTQQNFILPPTEQKVGREDVIFESKYNKVWKVVDVTDGKTAKNQVFHWQASVRNAQEYEQINLLRYPMDRPLPLAQRRLEPFSHNGQVRVVTYSNYQEDSKKMQEFIRATTILPGALEFGYDPLLVVDEDNVVMNSFNDTTTSDFSKSIDNLEESLLYCRKAMLPVAWFADDLRCGTAQIKPGVTHQDLTITYTPYNWKAGAVTRDAARLLSQYNSKPAFGGTPSDRSIVNAIQNMVNRNIDVVILPLLLCDIPNGNTKQNPNSSVGTFQPSYPHRSLLTAINDGSQTSQIDAFFGTAQPNHFAYDSVTKTVNYTGPDEWSYRRYVLHLATLAANAGPIKAFIVGSSLKGITRVKSGSTYPAIAQLVSLVAAVRTIVGENVKIGYSAAWNEYGADVNGLQVDFPMDALFSNSEVDFVGIDYTAPVTDWRDGVEHLDYAGADGTLYNPSYIKSCVCGGNQGQWKYTNPTNANSQTRADITDASYAKPWVFAPKQFLGWWNNLHYPRDNTGLQAVNPTSWLAQSKPIWFTTVQCSAVDKGTNNTGAIYDPKSSLSTRPDYSNGNRDDNVQRLFIEAFHEFWGNLLENPLSEVYNDRMVDVDNIYTWGWDARPFPVFPESTYWEDASYWSTGIGLTGRVAP